MTKDEVIASQTMINFELSNRVKELEEALNSIQIGLVGIGGPLNGNRLNFSREQLRPFFSMQEIIRDVL